MDGNSQTWLCSPFLFQARWILCPQDVGQQKLINHTVAHGLSKGLSLSQIFFLCCQCGTKARRLSNVKNCFQFLLFIKAWLVNRNLWSAFSFFLLLNHPLPWWQMLELWETLWFTFNQMHPPHVNLPDLSDTQPTLLSWFFLLSPPQRHVAWSSVFRSPDQLVHTSLSSSYSSRGERMDKHKMGCFIHAAHTQTIPTWPSDQYPQQ